VPQEVLGEKISSLKSDGDAIIDALDEVFSRDFG